MADAGADQAQLSESQQDALQQFISITNAEPSAAIPLLQRSQWNVNIAVTKFFDGEGPDPLEEARAQAASPPRAQTGQSEVLMDGFQAPRRTPAPSGRDPAPRVVPQPESQGVFKLPFLLSLVFSPFSLIFRVFGLLANVFPFLPRLGAYIASRNRSRTNRRSTTGRRTLNPRDAADRFIREFGEEHGTHTLPFQQTGYAHAYDLAKKDLKYLLVLLISPEHDDTSSFIRDTLLDPAVVSFINEPSNNILLWGGSVQDPEAYQVASALNASGFPFAALVVHSPQDGSTAMSTIVRVTGLHPPSSFLSKLRQAMSQHDAALHRVRTQRAEQQATRNLRQEQESAYERSLAQDRERMRQRREEEERRRAEEEAEEAQRAAEEKQAQLHEQWRRWRAHQLPQEPRPDVKDATRLSIRTADGERIVRKFASADTMDDLYAFVECQDLVGQDLEDVEAPPGYEPKYSFRLVSPMPRAVFDLGSGGTVGERIGRSANLIVEAILDEDEDEE